MAFAVIGFGSLLWDPQDLAPFGLSRELWHDDGPVFPLEFSWISKRRHGALTLVIDGNGSPCTTYWIELDDAHWDAVYSILRRRESQIDWVDGAGESPSDARHRSVWEWVQAHPMVGRAIWTSLAANFADEVGQPFSVAHALTYLAHLEETDPTGFASARTYIYEAPPQTQTPLGEAFLRRWPPHGSREFSV